MGKLIRNGIEYGGGNGTDIFKVTQAEYDALVQAGTLVHNALYVISDAPNLNPTASDIEFSSGVTVKQAIDSKASIKVASGSGTTSANGNINVSRANRFIIIGVWCNTAGIIGLPYAENYGVDEHGNTSWYLHFMNGNATQNSANNVSLTYYYAYIEV